MYIVKYVKENSSEFLHAAELAQNTFGKIFGIDNLRGKIIIGVFETDRQLKNKLTAMAAVRDNGEFLTIDCICVDNCFRGRKVGLSLVRCCEKTAADLKKEKLNLCAFDSVGFFEKCGFCRKDGENPLYMEKEVNNVSNGCGHSHCHW